MSEHNIALAYRRGWMEAMEAARAWQAFRDWCDKPTWQPIETAPRDGTEVLVYVPDYDSLTIAQRFGVGLWEGADGDYYYPTHWQPLPAPPSEVTP